MTSPRPQADPQRTLWSRGTPVLKTGWALRVGPVVLLILLALAGLRGALDAPRWNGPLRGAGIGVGLALIAVLVTLFVLTWLRHRAARADAVPVDSALAGRETEMDVAGKLRIVLLGMLSLGSISIVVALLYAAHLHLLVPARPRKPLPQTQRTPPPIRLPRTRPHAGTHLSIPFALIGYSLLVLALIAAIVLSIRWSARLRAPARLGREATGEEDSEDLREAVESGRSALRTLDDARAAIIACYLAMEQSLAERGAARAIADTPDELLARATRSKIVRGTSAARLTALFYEARFSSHPMDQAQRQAAEQALDELAAALAAPPLAEQPEPEPTAAASPPSAQEAP
jgi:hypothetical protein